MRSSLNQFGQPELANEQLRPDLVPSPDADYCNNIVPFALTFDAYTHLGSFDKVAEIANAASANFETNRLRPNNMDVLRTCLFFEQRRWRHFARDPSPDDLIYIRALVDAIRRNVVSLQ